MSIITISREMGSGGIPIAHRVAENLGYTLIDGDFLREAAPGYGLSPEAFDKADEKPPAFIEKIDHQLQLDLHIIELMILEFALKGDVIIYGRGGQDLLEGISSVLRVRIIAPFEERVERWAEREWIDPDWARILVRKSDQQRAGFIKYYFDRDWNDPLHYDLLINTSRLSDETAVKLICDGIRDKSLQERKTDCKKLLTDLVLRKRAEIRLLSEPRIEALHVGHFKLSVKNAVLQLEGHVHSETELKLVNDLTRGVDGIREVKGTLHIRHYQSVPDEH